jgi:DNA-binding NtrC family response regulator
MPAYEILVVDDELGIRNLLKTVLKAEGYTVRTAENGQEAVEAVRESLPDLILCDIKMPVKDGIEALKEIREISDDVLVVMLTAHGTIDTAVQAMKLGARDYLRKPFDVEELKVKIRRELDHADLRRTTRHYQEEAGLKYGLDRIVGQDPKMAAIYDLIRTVAPTRSTVLIRGESGTGKELIAGAIHYLSPRRNKPFVKVNCAAISEDLLESELFGHEKGAFTGAIRSNEGKFVMADGGSILLDEVSEMSAKLQAKLLRVLQEREVDKVGGREPVKVDVRMMATTNRNLEEYIKRGDFREDLFYRLNVVAIEFPPLRERKSDIPMLVNHFIDKYNKEMNKRITGISKEVESLLWKCDWPGNVRQLENVIERAVVLARNAVIGVDDLPLELRDSSPDRLLPNGNGPSVGMTVGEMERDLIFRTLETVGDNRTKAADMLGISIRTLRNKLNEYREAGFEWPRKAGG